MFRKGATAVMTLLVLTACSSGDDSNGSTDGSSGTSATVQAEAADQATTKDFAAVVAEHHADWDEQVATTKANCLDPDLVPACSMGYMTLGLEAETLALDLSTARKAGEPPAEIADLLDETEQAATAVKTAAEALQAAGCADPMELACSKPRVGLKGAIGDLSGKLDAWSVY